MRMIYWMMFEYFFMYNINIEKIENILYKIDDNKRILEKIK
jgi:hypothetical protein